MAEHSAEMAAKTAPLLKQGWSSCSTHEWLAKLQGAWLAARLVDGRARRQVHVAS